MSDRSFLVHVDDNARCAERIDYALRLAKAFGARIQGVYLEPGIDLYPFTASMLPPDFVEERMRGRLAAKNAAAEHFAKAASAAGVATLEWLAPAGDPHEMLTLHARYADLTVLGQPEAEAGDEAFASELAHAVLTGSGRPVLFVPYVGHVDTVAERVLVAWTNTREAARSIADARPVLERARHVEVVSIVAKEEASLADLVAEQELNACLARYGSSAKLRRVVGSADEAGELLLSRAADAGADLIVMGGYGHRRVRELVLGGVTRTMLRSMSVPVVMSH